MGFARAKEDRPTPPAIYNIRIYILAYLACLGSWMFGFNNGVIAGVLVLPSFYNDFHLPAVGSTEYNNITSNIVSMLQIGGLVGSMLTFGGMKYYGRRGAFVGSALIYLVGAILQTFSYGKLSMMYSGRLITGIGAGGVTVIVPLYLAEISPPAIRGSLVGIYEINNQFSSLLGYWSNYIVNEYVSPSLSKQWQIPLSIQIIPSSLLFIAALTILPESPRFLVQHGKSAKARKVLSFVRKLDEHDEYINMEMEEIEEAIRRQDEGGKGGRWGLWRELLWKGNFRRVVIGLCLMFGQNMTGIQGVNFYTPTVFRAIGFGGTKEVLMASGMYAAVKTIITLFSLIIFIDRTGRRKLLIASSIGTSLSLWYIGAYVTAKHIDLTSTSSTTSSTQSRSAAGWIAIVCVYIYAASFSIAWNGVVWVYCAEIFPTRIKELAVCIITTVQWTSQFAVARASPYMLSGMRGGFFFFFAACLVVMGVGVWFWIPETKGRTLERMDEIFGNAYEEHGEKVDGEGRGGAGSVFVSASGSASEVVVGGGDGSGSEREKSVSVPVAAVNGVEGEKNKKIGHVVVSV